MTITLDPVIGTKHHHRIGDVLRAKGLPGTVSYFDKHIEVSAPAWGDPESLEILRPIVEDVLRRIADDIRKKGK